MKRYKIDLAFAVYSQIIQDVNTSMTNWEYDGIH